MRRTVARCSSKINRWGTDEQDQQLEGSPSGMRVPQSQTATGPGTEGQLPEQQMNDDPSALKHCDASTMETSAPNAQRSEVIAQIVKEGLRRGRPLKPLEQKSASTL
jgi:hypothetical protein